MIDVVNEKIRSIDLKNTIEFSIGHISTHPEKDGHFKTRVKIYYNGKSYRERDSEHISPMLTLMSAISYVGINLRALAREHDLKLDLEGLTFDEYIPLSKGPRTAWDE